MRSRPSCSGYRIGRLGASVRRLNRFHMRANYPHGCFRGRPDRDRDRRGGCGDPELHRERADLQHDRQGPVRARHRRPAPGSQAGQPGGAGRAGRGGAPDGPGALRPPRGARRDPARRRRRSRGAAAAGRRRRPGVARRGAPARDRAQRATAAPRRGGARRRGRGRPSVARPRGLINRDIRYRYAHMARDRRYDLEDLANRVGTYFNPQTEVLVVVDDSTSIDSEIFNMEEFEGADWVLISDEVPLDETQRDEMLEHFQSTFRHGGSDLDEDEEEEKDELDEDEEEYGANGGYGDEDE